MTLQQGTKDISELAFFSLVLFVVLGLKGFTARKLIGTAKTMGSFKTVCDKLSVFFLFLTAPFSDSGINLDG